MKTIKEQIDNLQSGEHDVFNILANDIVVANYQITLSYFTAKYSNWKTENLKANFDLFKQLSKDDITRAYNAFYAEYNPIDNYNGTETRTIIENTGKKVNKNSGGTTVENMSTTFENVNYRPTDKTDTTFNNLESSEEFENTTVGDNSGHHVTVDNFTRHGNLGTTQTTEMIQNEISLRMYPYITKLLDNFIAEYCYRSGGVC